MPAAEYGDQGITELLWESDAALLDSLRIGLDVEVTLLRVRSWALIREIAEAQPGRPRWHTTQDRGRADRDRAGRTRRADRP
ncbi:hypothetical protein ACIRSS_23815 [Amycolatopsis sp. NPDC101161]|uniref:hypothetical protein n=1 Tax=Amycolatopsis sp. NPDC101161 TaxID=3363940 RepID=UPI00382FAF56